MLGEGLTFPSATLLGVVCLADYGWGIPSSGPGSLWWSDAEAAWLSEDQVCDRLGVVADTYRRLSLEGATLTLPEGDAYEYSGGEQRPMVKVVLPTGDLREGVDYTVSYSNNVDVGTASFLVTGIGGCFGTASGTFAITRASLADASIAPIPDQTLASPEVRPDLVVTLVGRTLSQGVDYDVAYSNNTGLGTATATVTGKGNYEGVKSATFRIVRGPVDISEATIQGVTDYVYTGSEVTQDDLLVKDGDATLVAGVDYTVAYKNNVNAGTATVTLTGMGNCTGTASTTFQIVPKPVADLQIEGAARTYTGSALTTDVTVKDGERTLVEGTDFTVGSFANNVNAGTGTFVVSGMGNYGEQAEGGFTINPKTVTVTANDAIKAYRSADPAFTATVDGLVAPDTDEISYGFSREAGSNVGTYAITPAGEEAQGNYGLAFVPGTLTIAPRSITKATIASIANKAYTGSAVKPALTVKDGTKALKSGTDFKVSYKNNVKLGTATVTITGMGNYKGTKSATFKIVAASVAKATVSKIANQKYDGKAKTPSPTVKVGTRTLKKGTDYTLTYKNNQKAGTATVTIKGKGNYTGSKNVTFKIVAMAGTWKGSGSKWWYQWKDGKYPTSVFLDISGKTYYFDASGYCVYGWRQIDKKYYYFESSGAMAKSKWVGNYWLGADGVMATNAWVDGGKYWVGADGVWVKGKTR